MRYGQYATAKGCVQALRCASEQSLAVVYWPYRTPPSGPYCLSIRVYGHVALPPISSPAGLLQLCASPPVLCCFWRLPPLYLDHLSSAQGYHYLNVCVCVCVCAFHVYLCQHTRAPTHAHTDSHLKVPAGNHILTPHPTLCVVWVTLLVPCGKL